MLLTSGDEDRAQQLSKFLDGRREKTVSRYARPIRTRAEAGAELCAMVRNPFARRMARLEVRQPERNAAS